MVGLVLTILGLTILVYVIVFSGTSRNLIEDQSQEINKQIVFNFERYINSVIETANYLQLVVGSRDVDRDTATLRGVFSLNREIKKDVVSIFLFDRDGVLILGNQVRAVAGRPITETDWFSAAVMRPEIYHFRVGMSSNVEIDRNDPVITVSRQVSYLRSGETHRGVLLVELNTEAVRELSDKTNLGEYGHILILDEHDQLVYVSEETPYSAASFPIAADTYLGGFETPVHDLDMYLHSNTLTGTRWRLVTVSNIDRVIGARRRVFYIIGIIGLLALVVTAVVAALISYRISRPIQQLRAIMERIESGDLDTEVNVEGQREIVQLAHSFNQMVVQVRELMQRLVTEQREKRKTELRALQNQINPHFLYNTLDSIVWLAEHQRNRDVVTTVIALAKFFRISISRGETFIPIAEELEHIENYLTIQKTRYVEKFEYEIAVDPRLAEYRVMKLILQPLVENAIYHGMGDDHGRIRVTGEIDGETILFHVQDSGYGLTEAKIAEMYAVMEGRKPGSSVGLRNVYQRLKLYYGETADVRIASVVDESTTITLVIPAQVPSGGQE
jgi:two-component system sensor histidine kinase YesM